MVYVEIGESRVPEAQATEGWITEHLKRRQDDGRSVCVRIIIETLDCNVSLPTRDCPSFGSSGWRPNPLEQRVIDLWEERVRKHPKPAPGHIVSFLRS
jgi:hypothetical protein